MKTETAMAWFKAAVEVYEDEHEARQAAEARCAALEGALRTVLESLGECSLDHHGTCQAHFFSRPCEVAEARALLSAGTGPAREERTP